MKFWPVLLCLCASAAFAATPRECQQFLKSHSVRQQCGPTCVIHTLTGILEAHSLQPLSVEYALLNELAQETRSRLPTGLAPGARSWLTALLSVARGGVRFEAEFLTQPSRIWFQNRFKVSLDEPGILKLGTQNPDLVRDPWWRGHARAGREAWVELAKRLTLELLTSDLLAYSEMKPYEHELRALGMDIEIDYRLKDEVELDVYESLNVGYPVAVILEPRHGRRHAEIATHRLPGGAVVTRNTAAVQHWFYWERPAPLVERSAQDFHRKLIGALFVREKN